MLTYIETDLAERRDHSKVPASLVMTVASPGRKSGCLPTFTHGRRGTPDARFERPVMVITCVAGLSPREPRMTILAGPAARGVTSADGGDQAPQPAPLRARTRKVYDVPLMSPVISQDSAVVRQLPADGDEATW